MRVFGTLETFVLFIEINAINYLKFIDSSILFSDQNNQQCSNSELVLQNNYLLGLIALLVFDNRHFTLTTKSVLFIIFVIYNDFPIM